MHIDTHAHLNFKSFEDDYKKVIDDSLKGSCYVLIPGSQYQTSQKAVEIANEYDYGVWSAVALHPTHLEKRRIREENTEFVSAGEEFDEKKYFNLTKNNKVIAIGETGLDFYRTEDENFKELQKRVFVKHLELSQKTDLPVIVHCRKAFKETLDILDSFKDIRAVIHSFTGTGEDAKAFLDKGIFFSFNGLITFADEWDAIIGELPLEKIMAETDSPYMTPVPFRGKRNQPTYVKLVVKKIAELKRIEVKEAEEKIFSNSMSFFKLKNNV